ncbi:P-loop NTPase [Acaryochloris sp. IP29b_bin.137]|uniref:GumC family protein n=1 Tax=Acaryochloris sp. IP29b_bin.137 TaxID=2969217 RepID=UPI00263894F7|nr:P-loop NTPase [Acaryochloris sp. IP29b_bin.137]
MSRFTSLLREHWLPLLVINTGLWSLVIYFLVATPRTWTAQAELIVPDTTSELEADLGTLGNLNSGDGVSYTQQLNPLKSLMSVLLSGDTLRPVWQADPEQGDFPRLGAYRSLFSLSPQSESTILTLRVEGSSPALAQQRSTALINRLQMRLSELRSGDANERSKFLKIEQEKARSKLEAARSALTQFQQTSKLVDSQAQTGQLVTTVETLSNQQAQLLAEAEAREVQVRMLSVRLNLSPAEAVRSLKLGENKTYDFSRKRLSEIEAQLAAKRTELTDRNPEVLQLLEERRSLQRQLAIQISNAVSQNRPSGENSASLIQQLVLAESESQALRRQANALQQQIDRKQVAIQSLPAQQSRLLELRRQYGIAEGVYKGIEAQIQQTNLNAFSTYPSVQVLDRPDVDPLPTSPKRRLMILGGLLSSLLGSAAVILWRENWNPFLRPSDLEATALPVLRRIRKLQSLDSSTDIRFETAVELQCLASTISMTHLSKGRLLISSSGAGEGKTTITLGLAIALTILGFRVLIVDGDWYQADLSRRLGYGNYGLSDYQGLPVQIRSNLDLLPISPRPEGMSEYIASGTFAHHLSEVQTGGDYDYVLVDSPPVSLTNETLLMARAIPQVMFVVWPEQSKRQIFVDGIEQLKRHRAQIIGLVVNGESAPQGRYQDRIMSGLAKMLLHVEATTVSDDARYDTTDSEQR